ncbi:hypothetical protein GCM10022233_87290 [Streptomyces shaanxiensis]|uniref:Uncharacterized protein n=1 Tax=Streptomyces shaanxiensis TaxID=653357 RepID=A0ABP7WJU2_9ACTN
MTAPSGECDRTMTVPHQSPSHSPMAADLVFAALQIDSPTPFPSFPKVLLSRTRVLAHARVRAAVVPHCRRRPGS